MFITETLKTEMNQDYDIAVCGGGIAGISAALAAARLGKKVILFEKQFLLGGLATLGLVTIYLPICDGHGHQVSFGIAEELLRLSIQGGAEGRFPNNWLQKNGSKGINQRRFEVQYNPHMFALLAEKLLNEAGVHIRYGTYVVAAYTEKNRISHLVTEDKSGRKAYAVKTVIDATGDCDIAKMAGLPIALYKKGNILAYWYYSIGENGYRLNKLGIKEEPDDNEVGLPSKDKAEGKTFQGVEGAEISEFVCNSHEYMLSHIEDRREEDDTWTPVTSATIPQLRMTRKIVGEYKLRFAEKHRYFEDSIGMIGNWKKRGPIYEIPFRTLYNRKIVNLICAGRCISVDDALWDITRVIPACAVTGQAAGTAAAMTEDFEVLDIPTLQECLQQNGVRLHENEIK